MGTSSLSALLDDKVIHCTYYREIFSGESVAPVDLSISVKHQYVTSANVANEIILEQFIIPKDYLETKGLMGVSDVEQTLEFHVINLRYLDNLHVEVQEVRDGTPVLTRVPVNKGGDYETVEPLPNNPERYVEHDENIPEVVPERNISVQKTDSGVWYLLNSNDLVVGQISKRIFLNEENGEQDFIQTDYNEESNKVFIENSITNLLPNPQFTGTDVPDAWEIDAPSIIYNSYVLTSDLPDINIWQIRASNTNLFSAFNSISLKTKEKNILYAGLDALTFSVYYRAKCSSDIPFENFKCKIFFYCNEDFIRSEELILSVSSQQKIWKLLSFSFQSSQIPATANKYQLEFDIANIDATDLFNLEIYLPQLEASPVATTRTIDSRIQDKYATTPFEMKLPFYILARTYHVTGQGNRGLCSSTTNQVNGFEFLTSNDKLRFKLYDSNGNIQVNVISSPFPASITAGTVVDYSIWVTDSLIEFYANNVLLSSHPVTLAITQNQYYTVGTLEKSNTTINSELLDFKILGYRP